MHHMTYSFPKQEMPFVTKYGIPFWGENMGITNLAGQMENLEGSDSNYFHSGGGGEW
jgi:hypothetical protein